MTPTKYDHSLVGSPQQFLRNHRALSGLADSARCRHGGGARHADPVCYLTPLWPEQHAATAIAALWSTSRSWPAPPPAGTWSVRLGECCYELGHQDVGPTPGEAPPGQWKSVKPPTPPLTADLNGVLQQRLPAQRHAHSSGSTAL